jgi:bacteriocin resistance YdeI/OmpD-like protein/uncharacterized protein DUF1905
MGIVLASQYRHYGNQHNSNDNQDGNGLHRRSSSDVLDARSVPRAVVYAVEWPAGLALWKGREMAALKKPGPIEFDAEIMTEEGAGSVAWVEFPFDLKETYGKGNLVPVNALFDGRVAYRGSLATMGGDCGLLMIRTDKRNELGKKPGDRIRVRVELDTEPRTIELSADAQSALDAMPAVAEQWNALSYSHQREYHQWIEEAKRPETRQKRIAKMVEMVGEGLRLK